MKTEYHHIDNTFKEGLANSEMTPPSYIWDSIEKQLNTNRRNRSVLVIWRGISAAAIIGFIFLAGLFWFTHSNNNKASLALTNNAKKIAISNAKKIATNKSTPQDKTTSSIILNNRNNNDNNDNTSPYENDTISIKSKEKSYAKSEYKPLINKPNFVNTNNSTLTKILPKSTVKINSYTQVNATQLFNYRNNSISSYAVTNALFLSPFNNIKEEKEKKSLQIAIGGQFSPSYSYREVSSSENYNTSAAKESGLVSYTGGLNLNIKTPKRWSFETGVYYAQVGQKFSNPRNEFSGLQYFSANLSGEPEPITNSGLNLNNSLGRIKLNNNSQKNLQDESANYLKLSYKTVQNSYNTTEQLTIQQELDFIEIPLVLRYDIINKAIIFSLAGGVSTNFLIGNNAYQVENNSKERIGETENINNINYSAVFGIGFRTPIWKSIEFNFEPKIRYFMNSVTNSDVNKYRPYSIGIYTGICYRFK